MEMIGSYEKLTPFTNENAGTSEWCRAQKDGRPYFIKKFLKPVYPSEELGLTEKKHANAVKRFHTALEMQLRPMRYSITSPKFSMTRSPTNCGHTTLKP